MSKRSFPNWYKLAEVALNITPAEFVDMTRQERIFLARNRSITPETQRLFFTEKYSEKYWPLANLAQNESITQVTQRLFFTRTNGRRNDLILAFLAENRGITPETQLMFFTEQYNRKGGVLRDLARNSSITPLTQRLFFTQNYANKGVLWFLAVNRGITQETQRLFFTEEYSDKNEVLKILFQNPSFLKGLTPKEMREFTKTNKLTVYSKRLRQIKLLRL